MLLSDFTPKKPRLNVVEVHESDQLTPAATRGGHNKLNSKEDYLDKRDVLFRLLSQPGVDPETKAKARERLLDLEKAARLAGIINEEENAMAQAVTRRIIHQHPDWIMQYGVELLLQVIDDVTEGEDDWEEIGSSDVSAYVKMVHDQLQSRGGSREEMRDRPAFSEGMMSEIDIELHNIAQSEDEEELIDAMGGLKGTGVQIALEDMMSELADELAAKGMNDVINDQDKMVELLMDKIVEEFGDGDVDTIESDDGKPRFTGAPQRDRNPPPIQNSKMLPPAPGRPTFIGKPNSGKIEPSKKTTESLRNGEYHVATVTLKDGTEKKVKIRSDEGFRDPIIKHFAKQGLEVQDIKVDWSVRSNESNDRPLSFVTPAKNNDLGYIKLIVHKVKNNKPVSRQEKDDLNKYLASTLMKEEEHGDLRTGWVLKAAKRAFPMAATDEEALAMWINDRVEKDVNRLDRENDREDRDIDRLDSENDQEQRMLSQMNTRDEQIEKKLNDLQAQVNVLYKADGERKPSRLESRLSTRATSKEISKYLAEMKKAGYDI